MIKVLVIDDSALMRQLLTFMLSTDEDIIVVGEAKDAYEARELIKQLNPDVLTLDVEMPKMDGLAFLRNLMRLRPMPVVMVSSLTQKGADVTLEALSLGAIDYVAKPQQNNHNALGLFQANLTSKVKNAAQVEFGPPKVRHKESSQTLNVSQAQLQRVIAIGASTGGTEAIQEILTALPSLMPPIVIAQHIPPVFSASFAARLNKNTSLNVVEAQGGEQLQPGSVYIAPGSKHLTIKKYRKGYMTELLDTPPVNRHKPSVDVLFDSVAKACSSAAIGVLLTGMGSDGSNGLLNIRNQGAFTIAQDKMSSVVWGMPGSAIALDACNEVLPLDRISHKLMLLLK